VVKEGALGMSNLSQAKMQRADACARARGRKFRRTWEPGVESLLACGSPFFRSSSSSRRSLPLPSALVSISTLRGRSCPSRVTVRPWHRP
jgi:hypothetical protein